MAEPDRDDHGRDDDGTEDPRADRGDGPRARRDREEPDGAARLDDVADRGRRSAERSDRDDRGDRRPEKPRRGERRREPERPVDDGPREGSGSGAPETLFPVVTEQPLTAPGRRYLRLFRDPTGLPPLRPGCVYVFGTRGRYVEATDGRLTGREPDLVDADSVSVVDVRPRTVDAHMRIHSASPATEFVVRVSFDVKVSSASEVAAAGLTNLSTSIATVLAQDPTLLEYHHRFGVDDIADVRTQVVAYLMSTYRQRPPRFEGLRLFLQNVQVFTPRGLRRHASVLQNASWTAEEARQDRAEELRRVAHEERLLETAETAWAAAVASGDATRADVAERMSDTEAERERRAYAELQDMRTAGALNLMPNHQRRIADAGVAALGQGSDAPAPPQRPQPPRSLPQVHESDEPPLFVPPEDEDDHEF